MATASEAIMIELEKEVRWIFFKLILDNGWLRLDIGYWKLDIGSFQHLSLKGCEWIKSERFQKKQAEEQKRKDKENPMRVSNFFICSIGD